MLAVLRHIWFGVRTLGVLKSAQVGLYPLRRAYHEARFRRNPRGSLWDGLTGFLRTKPDRRQTLDLDSAGFQPLGAVSSYGGDDSSTTFVCSNGRLIVTILSPEA